MCADRNSNDQFRERFEDEITLSDLIDSLAGYVNWVRKNLVQLVVFIILGVAITVFWRFQQPEEYVAELTFMLNDENNPQVSGLSSVLGQLGIPFSGGKYNVDKLLEISKSRNLISSTLMTSKNVDGKEDLLANHFLEILDLKSQWKFEEESLEGFSFEIENLENQDARTLYVNKSLIDLITGPKSDRSKGLFTTDYGRTDYIMSFLLRSPSAELSMSFINELYDQVSNFYINQATQKNAQVLKIIEGKRDSIEALINTTAFRVADLKDKSLGSFRNTNRVEIALLESQLAALRGAAEETAKNLERAEFVLETRTPLIQILDRPLPPLYPQKSSLMRAILMGIVMGIIFYLFLLFTVRVLRVSQQKS